MKLYRLDSPTWDSPYYVTAAPSVEKAIEQICKFLEKKIEDEGKYGSRALKNMAEDELSKIREWHKNCYTLEIKEIDGVFEGAWPL